MPKHKPAHYVEYAVLRLVGWLLCLLPYYAALALGCCFAKLSFLLMGKRMRRAKARVMQVFGGRFGKQEAGRIVWIAWRNLVFNGIEMLRAPRVNLRWVNKYTDYSQFEKVLAKLKSGQNVILALPHMGSWETAGLSASLLGVPLLFITRQQKNVLIGNFINRIRSRTGQECVDRDLPLLRVILKKIKEGKVLAILPDIRARTDAMEVDFLGGRPMIAAGMALFARQAGVPIFSGCVIREGWGRHKWIVYDEITPDPSLEKSADWLRMTQAVMSNFDHLIGLHPDQYFWFNKKWILEPPADHETD
ncbi:MAG: lysophospholipid acyltransferase family protein [Kiritimatiellia bacterium]